MKDDPVMQRLSELIGWLEQSVMRMVAEAATARNAGVPEQQAVEQAVDRFLNSASSDPQKMSLARKFVEQLPPVSQSRHDSEVSR